LATILANSLPYWQAMPVLCIITCCLRPPRLIVVSHFPIIRHFFCHTNLQQRTKCLPNGMSSTTVYTGCLSFSGSSPADALATRLKSTFTAIFSSSAVAAGHSSSEPPSHLPQKGVRACNQRKESESGRRHLMMTRMVRNTMMPKTMTMTTTTISTLLVCGMEEFFADYSHLTAVGTNANNNIISTTHINNTVKDLPITIRAISSSNSAFNRVISSTSANALHSYSANATAMRINNSWTVRSP